MSDQNETTSEEAALLAMMREGACPPLNKSGIGRPLFDFRARFFDL